MLRDLDELASKRRNDKLEAAIIQRDVQAAIKEAGCSVELLSLEVASRARLIELPSGFVVRLQEGNERVTAEDYVAKLKKDPKMMAAFGDAALNPWDEKTFNFTDQMRIERQNPSHAARLKAKVVAAKLKQTNATHK